MKVCTNKTIYSNCWFMALYILFKYRRGKIMRYDKSYKWYELKGLHLIVNVDNRMIDFRFDRSFPNPKWFGVLFFRGHFYIENLGNKSTLYNNRCDK